MKEKITHLSQLIRNSRAIIEEKKELYIQGLEFFSPEALAELESLLESEKNRLEEIHAQDAIEREKINQDASQKMEVTLKTALKLATAEQESGEKESAEDILQKLDTL